MGQELRIEGFAELMARLEQLKKQDANKMLNRALREGAKVFQQQEAARAPERPDLPSSTALPPGALKSDVSIKKVRGLTVYLIGPGRYTSRAAHLVELGHRLVRGGRNRLLKNGKTKGSGAVVGQVPPHPYIRPAYEAGSTPALAAIKASLQDSIRRLDRRNAKAGG